MKGDFTEVQRLMELAKNALSVVSQSQRTQASDSESDDEDDAIAGESTPVQQQQQTADVEMAQEPETAPEEDDGWTTVKTKRGGRRK